ncbi:MULTISPECIES: hypothetical protein [unclassified Halomonas]|uniref:hypothetical protein n=1 Tax=unclassified Halomonas TaxID=2609666 RepID=UPI001C98E29D|nr:MULTISPECIES: hypothetical protein [unclassified Halomonas]MBY5927339.1 hypothetical protein [Halomonas sp. DP4Y7-2]MBY6234380.1 hypothetical protein [Halomonas sp. DP4Y7-1]
MTIFEIEKDDLLRLSDTLLEELIARLAEAEVAANGYSPASVSWSGSIKAPDEGIDIHVQVNDSEIDTGFLTRSDTILQSKKDSMPKSAISAEMKKDGNLNPILADQAKIGGSFIIVSLSDDCSPPMKKGRLDAMQAAVANDPNKDNIHLDFFDRSKLVQWLRQHPSVLLWVKSKLGQGYSGWQPYGAWSNPPKGSSDTLISAPGVTVHVPTVRGQQLLIEDAIEPMRRLIRTSDKATRITGLSGVGKTRIVQALFDETVGDDPLDRTVAVYVDTGQDPNPSASAMLDRLIAEGRRAVMILDNCPSDLHSALASKVSAARGDVSLITVEYDIRDDKPQTTEVIHIEANGPEVAEELLLRRFPTIGQGNARRVAEFADGNSRVALAIAERVEQGESLAELSDAELFDRLFQQRKGQDGDLREKAETLSLVYSFSLSDSEVGQDELEVLGSISGYTKAQLFRATKKLADRHVVQKRASWRAILPHAVANRLASSALESVSVETLRSTFEAPGNSRLLMSFAHRLGLMHDHPVAREIVEAWLQPDDLLGRISELEENGTRILNYIGPVAPDTLLDRIEAEFTAPGFQGMEPMHNPRRTTILSLLRSLAYEAHAFDRCMSLLIRVADHEDESNNYDAVRDTITGFFQPYLSGTHASMQQRIAIVEECLGSEDQGRRSLGIKLLSTALDGPPWTGFGLNEFGARPRDYGYRPTHDQLVEWRTAFMNLAVRLANSDGEDIKSRARLVLANEFRGLWHHEAIRKELVAAARAVNDHQPWGEGWKAVRSIIYFDHTRQKDEPETEPLPQDLADLDRDLEPRNLITKIKTYVLGKGHDYWALDDEFDDGSDDKYRDAEDRLATKATDLGEGFAASDHELDELGSELFSREWMPYRRAFGIGLAKGSHNYREGWQSLLEHLARSSGSNYDFAVIGGFIEEVAANDNALSRELLDECAEHSELRKVLVDLHPWDDFTESDLDRCMALLDNEETGAWMFGPILWRDNYAHLPSESLLVLAQKLLTKSDGGGTLLEALSMKLHGTSPEDDTLGPELRKIGLKAATKSLLDDHSDSAGSKDYCMENVIMAALSFDGNDAEKIEWVDTIFSFVDECYGYIHSFEEAIATTAGLMPKAFLNRVFQGTQDQQHRRNFFIRHGDIRLCPLSKIDVADLIEWCQQRNEADVWCLVASGIRLWENGDGNRDSSSITSSAVEFLEAAPEPEPVLHAYAARVTPSSWSGSRADVMQPRTDAIAELTQHRREEIAKAAGSVSALLTMEIERERMRDRQRDEEREQRFE